MTGSTQEPQGHWVDPEMAKILKSLEGAPVADFRTMPVAEVRALSDAGYIAWNSGAPAVPVHTFTIPGAPHPMRARLFYPVEGDVANGKPLPLIVYVHGGGWTFGSVDTHDGIMRTLAIATGAAVLGFDYRLAPEYPFPAPLNDTLAAITYALSGELGPAVDVRRWALAGDSAGANLALAAMLARRNAGEALPAVAALFYGCYALDFDTESYRQFGEGYLLTRAGMRWYWRNYIGDVFDTSDTLAVPLDTDLAGLPPLYLTSAGLDPLAEDTRRLARRLAAASVAHRHDHAPGVVHGCLRMSRSLGAAQRMFTGFGEYFSTILGFNKTCYLAAFKDPQ